MVKPKCILQYCIVLRIKEKGGMNMKYVTFEIRISGKTSWIYSQ